MNWWYRDGCIDDWIDGSMIDMDGLMIVINDRMDQTMDKWMDQLLDGWFKVEGEGCGWLKFGLE
jgi:hypothetical protein